MDIFDIKNNAQISDIANKVWNDFYGGATTNPWVGASISGGTSSQTTGTGKHPGVRAFVSSTSGFSGYSYLTGTASLSIIGAEKPTFIFKTPTVQATIIRKMGFHNAVDSGALTDGVFATITDGVIKGSCKNNNVGTDTSSNYTLLSDTWYRLKIELSNDLSKATFTLYQDDSSNVLWTDTITTNIPVGRTTGHGDLAYSTGTTAITLGYLDYIDMILPNARRVA